MANEAHKTRSPLRVRVPRPALRGRRRSVSVVPQPQAIVRSIESATNQWIDIRMPTAEEIEYLGQTFGFHELMLEDISARIQRPKIDVYDDCLYIVMHFPVHDPDKRINIAAEVDMIVGSDYFITVHDGSLKPLTNMVDSIFDSPELSRKLLEQTTGHMLYEVIDRLVDYTVPIVPKLEERIERIEDSIFENQGLDTVREIALVRRDLISLQRILKPQLAIVNQLEYRDFSLLNRDIDDYWGDIADHLGRTWDSLEDFREVVEGLSDTHDKLMNQQMNDIIKTLTIISVVLLPLTLISGIFGMNVPLPYQNSIRAYLIILAAMMIMVFLMLLLFRNRRWI